MQELTQKFSSQELNRILENQLRFGMYPEIINNPADAEKNLKEIAESYLYKNVLQFLNIKKSDILYKLLQAIALQNGSEVSYNELANLLGIDKKLFTTTF